VSLAPLLAAPLAIQLHALAALAAVGLAAWQLLAPKGDAGHRGVGWVWVVVMAAVALSSFGIRSASSWAVSPFGLGPFGPIHALSVATLVFLAKGVAEARAGRIKAHRITMLSLVFGALVITGGFTLLPGRLMGAVVLAW